MSNDHNSGGDTTEFTDLERRLNDYGTTLRDHVRTPLPQPAPSYRTPALVLAAAAALIVLGAIFIPQLRTSGSEIDIAAGTSGGGTPAAGVGAGSDDDADEPSGGAAAPAATATSADAVPASTTEADPTAEPTPDDNGGDGTETTVLPTPTPQPTPDDSSDDANAAPVAPTPTPLPTPPGSSDVTYNCPENSEPAGPDRDDCVIRAKPQPNLAAIEAACQAQASNPRLYMDSEACYEVHAEVCGDGIPIPATRSCRRYTGPPTGESMCESGFSLTRYAVDASTTGIRCTKPGTTEVRCLEGEPSGDDACIVIAPSGDKCTADLIDNPTIYVDRCWVPTPPVCPSVATLITDPYRCTVDVDPVCPDGYQSSPAPDQGPTVCRRTDIKPDVFCPAPSIVYFGGSGIVAAYYCVTTYETATLNVPATCLSEDSVVNPNGASGPNGRTCNRIAGQPVITCSAGVYDPVSATCITEAPVICPLGSTGELGGCKMVVAITCVDGSQIINGECMRAVDVGAICESGYTLDTAGQCVRPGQFQLVCIDGEFEGDSCIVVGAPPTNAGCSDQTDADGQCYFEELWSCGAVQDSSCAAVLARYDSPYACSSGFALDADGVFCVRYIARVPTGGN